MAARATSAEEQAEIAPAGWGSPGLAYLEGYLRLLWDRAAALVAVRRAQIANPDDQFRGLYISDADTDAIFAEAPPGLADSREPGWCDNGDLDDLNSRARAAVADGADVRLLRLAQDFGLDALDVALLVVAAAPDIDRRFERLYGYLNDDVSRRRATCGLALELCGVPAADADGRARLSAPSRLIEGGLIAIEELERPALTRQLRVPDRVVGFLLGDDRVADELAEATIPWVRCAREDDDASLARAVSAGQSAVYVRESAPGSGALSWAGSVLAEADIASIAIDLAALAGAEDQRELARCARREALLRSAVLLATNVDTLAEAGVDRVRPWTQGPGVVVFTGAANWDRRWSRRPPTVLEVAPLDDAARLRLWQSLGAPDVCVDNDGTATLVGYRLTPEQIAQTLIAARACAAAHGRGVESEDLYAGARAQNGSGLEQLARRVEPRATFDDLVVPGYLEGQLRGIVARVRHRQTVLDEWAMTSASQRGRGVTSLFAGSSGTGKTMSAEVVANALGFSLYVVDLSSVVDKYVGETEKKLDQIFREAEQVNAVLLFDEADAIFGKRSEVRAAQDRYANLEVAYLLQRMEQFAGIAVLTTNLRANIDEAFLRRLDVLVDFPVPEADDRRRIWTIQLPERVPLGDDIDLDFLATSFPLSGGNIRNIALAAAFAAAEADVPIGMSHLIRATAGEYRKLGRMCVASEFGPYFDLTQS